MSAMPSSRASQASSGGKGYRDNRCVMSDDRLLMYLDGIEKKPITEYDSVIKSIPKYTEICIFPYESRQIFGVKPRWLC